MNDFTTEEIVAKLNIKMGTTLTAQDYMDWLEGGRHYDRFDEVVRKFMGDGLYEEAEQLARLNTVFEAKLTGEARVKVGGILFTNLQS